MFQATRFFVVIWSIHFLLSAVSVIRWSFEASLFHNLALGCTQPNSNGYFELERKSLRASKEQNKRGVSFLINNEPELNSTIEGQDEELGIDNSDEHVAPEQETSEANVFQTDEFQFYRESLKETSPSQPKEVEVETAGEHESSQTEGSEIHVMTVTKAAVVDSVPFMDTLIEKREGLASNIEDRLKTSRIVNKPEEKKMDLILTKGELQLHSDPYAAMMVQKEAKLSVGHQTKFSRCRSSIIDRFERYRRFHAYTAEFAAVPLSDQFAYIHVWKSGGTTVEYQARRIQTRLSDPEVSGKDWMTFVRDPIDHFLSGWAEVGIRIHEKETQGGKEADKSKWEAKDYNVRVKEFLDELKALTAHDTIPEMTEHTHAFPQANFLINEKGEINNRVKVVGDLRDMAQIMDIVGFSQYDKNVVGRVSQENSIKQKYFNAKRHMLSDENIRAICEFVALDYFLFDFEPPVQCVQVGGPLDFTNAGC